MTETTARHNLPLLVTGQGQKDITHNEAILLVDALSSAVVESRTLGTPPSNPQEGLCWLVAEPAAGIWAGRGGQLAVWTAGGWRYARIPDGMLVYVKGEGLAIRRVGAAWRNEAPVGAPVAAVAAPTGGTVVDLQARTAIAAITSRLQQLGLVAN